MPGSAVPNTDLPGPDLPETGADGDLPETGAGGVPEVALGPATLLRCDGCGARAEIDQDEHNYGGLVHGFLSQHSACGNAVQITRIRPGDG